LAVKSLVESARRYEDALGKRAPTASAGEAGEVAQRTALSIREEADQRARSASAAVVQHQIYAPGFYTGYGVKTIPGVREAIEEKHWDEIEPEMKKAVAAFRRLLHRSMRRLGCWREDRSFTAPG